MTKKSWGILDIDISKYFFNKYGVISHTAMILEVCFKAEESTSNFLEERGSRKKSGLCPGNLKI